MSPQTTPTPVAGPPFTLSGTVYEATSTGRRPLAGVPLDVSLEYQQRTPRVTSDSAGRYSVSIGSAESHKVAAELEGYSQPCRASVALTADGVLDVYVVANSLLERVAIPPSLPVVQPTLTGRVFERTTSGLRPVSGAKVYMDFSAGFGIAPSANTVTDSAGRYLLCNVQDVGWGLTVNAWKYPRYSEARHVPTPITSEVDLEIVER